MGRILGRERDPFGTTTTFVKTEDGIGVHTQADVQPVVDANRRAYNDAPDRFGGNQAMHKVASIPGVILEKFARENGIPWPEFIAQKSDRSVKAWNTLLNHPDLRAFRTRPGRVQVKRK